MLRRALLLPLLLLAVPLSAQFAIPPSGVGAALYGVWEFGAAQFPDGLVRVFWSSRGAIWSVPLNEALEPGMPALVPGSLPPVAEAVVGETLLAAVECESEAGVRSVCLQRFDREGVLLDSILVDENAHAPMVASTGGEALFVFTDGLTPPFRVIAVPVGEDGLLGARIDLGPWAPFSHAPSLAASGGSFYVAWSDGSFRLAEIRGSEIVRTLPLTGTVGDEVIHHYDLAGSDEGLLILASIGTGVGGGTIRAKILDSNGGWTDISNQAWLGRAKAVAVAGGWIAAWYDGGWLRARRIGIDGTLGPVSDVSEGRKGVGGLDLEPHASGAIVFFRARQGAGAYDSRGDDLRMRVLDFDARPVAPSSIVSLATAPQVMPDGAWDGSSYLVVWNERDIEGFWRVRGARLSAAGELLNRVDFPFEEKDQLHPAIGFNGESHFVVWSEGPSGVEGVAGVRIAIDGSLHDEGSIPIFEEGAAIPDNLVPQSPRTAHVEWSGTDWIVVSSSADHAIVARRISASGVPLTPPVVLVSADEFGLHRNPLLSCGESSCLLAWRAPIKWMCSYTCPVWPDTVFALRITRDLTLLDSYDRYSGYLSTPYGGAGGGHGLDVAWNPRARAWMVAWSVGPGGRRVDEDGSWTRIELQGGESVMAVVPEKEGWRLASIASSSTVGLANARVLVHGYIDAAFEGPEALKDRRGLWRSEVPWWSSPSVRIVESPRPLALISIAEAATGQPYLFGRFLDERWERHRAVGRR